MRIALLTNFVAPYRVPLLQAIARRCDGLRVFVSTRMEANREWAAVDTGGLDVVVQRNVTITRQWYHPRGYYHPNYVHIPYDTIPALARFRPDVVISGEMGPRTIQSVAWGQYIGHRPVLVWATLSERLEEGRSRAREGVRQWLLSRAAGVLVNGESGARYIRRFAVPEERIFRVPQPIDVSQFAAAPLTRPAAAAHRLLYVGNLIPLKGLRELFDALERRAQAAPDRSIELTMVGTGPLREELERRPRPPNLRVDWVGHVPYSELPALYAAHGILVFPSVIDEWGLVVNEAMASGLPVLGCTLAQAVDELVEEGRNGWRFDAEDAHSFDGAVARALGTSPGELDTMRVAARARAQQHDPEDGARRVMEAVRVVA